MVNYKLHYFDFRGLGETIRLIFHFADQNYEEVPINVADWPQKKATTPFGKVPVLEVDGQPLAQMFAIARYLARQYGIAGKDLWEQAKVDEFADFHKDVSNEIAPYLRAVVGIVPADKDKLYKEAFLPALEKYLPVYEKKLKASPSGYLMPSGLTWIDFTVADCFTTVHGMHPEALTKYPEVEKHRQRVLSHPRVKSYVDGRKQTPL